MHRFVTYRFYPAVSLITPACIRSSIRCCGGIGSLITLPIVSEHHEVSERGVDMIMNELDTLLRKLNVTGASPEKMLEADLNLDLLERQCIREDVEESLHIIISDDEIQTDLTVLELAGLLSRKLLATPGQQHFEGKLVEDTVIMAPASRVAQRLHEVSFWPRFLPNVRSVSVTYDDGVYQEFVLDLDDSHRGSTGVRLVRRCEPDHIAYFHPEPDVFLQYHCGDWFVRPLAQTAAHLTVVQRWTRSAKAETAFRSCDTISSVEQVKLLLRERARNELVAWKRSLEGEAV
jgi:hypothetical protein